jgi:Ribbon-helix-helix protein, copG family
MGSNHLTLRLSSQEARLIEQLRTASGLSKSDIVKRALHAWAAAAPPASGAQAPSLFDLGEASFGKHANAARQSSNIKSVVRAQLRAKRRP